MIVCPVDDVFGLFNVGFRPGETLSIFLVDPRIGKIWDGET